ncbi:MAG TPA: chemotaxis response regulator protein-glutamate methylesterase [Burkholderiales bacterium]|nr:chemotaxis response regulator protein-glutamate methylesterase [Burkholderiales bacterium]
MRKTKVMVVDDSAVVRQVIAHTLARERSIEVLAAVADPIFAMQRMRAAWPDVIVLDVEMPRMDGITFLRKIMADRPTPVVICSSLTVAGAETTMLALAAGAVTIVAKPKAGVRNFLLDASADLVEAVKAAACANVRNLAPRSADVCAPAPGAALKETTERVVALGTSTGGTQALESVLSALPRSCAGIVVVQHMPEKFTAAFSQRLDQVCAIEVKEAQDNDRVLPGRALIAPGGRQMTLKRSGALYYVEVRSAPPVNRHCPSVDVLFRSVARSAGKNALGVVMTGMGHDGARGLLEMREAGAQTAAQDEASCVVFGMPKEAIKLGAAEKVLPLHAISGEISLYGSR